MASFPGASHPSITPPPPPPPHKPVADTISHDADLECARAGQQEVKARVSCEETSEKMSQMDNSTCKPSACKVVKEGSAVNIARAAVSEASSANACDDDVLAGLRSRGLVARMSRAWDAREEAATTKELACDSIATEVYVGKEHTKKEMTECTEDNVSFTSAQDAFGEENEGEGMMNEMMSKSKVDITDMHVDTQGCVAVARGVDSVVTSCSSGERNCEDEEETFVTFGLCMPQLRLGGRGGVSPAGFMGGERDDAGRDIVSAAARDRRRAAEGVAMGVGLGERETRRLGSRDCETDVCGVRKTKSGLTGSCDRFGSGLGANGKRVSKERDGSERGREDVGFVTIRRVVRQTMKDGRVRMVTNLERVRPERVLENGDVVVKRVMKREKEGGGGVETLSVLQVIPRSRKREEAGKKKAAGKENVKGGGNEHEEQEFIRLKERSASLPVRRSTRGGAEGRGEGKGEGDEIWDRARSFCRVEQVGNEGLVLGGGQRQSEGVNTHREGAKGMWRKASLPRLLSFQTRREGHDEGGNRKREKERGGMWWRSGRRRG